MNYKDAYQKLEKYNQLHILTHYDSLTANEQKNLLAQIDDIDFDVLKVLNHKETEGNMRTVPISPHDIETIKKNHDRYKTTGISTIRRGELALVLLAGGQGTRLGFSGPKGTFNVGVTKELYIFELLVKHTLKVVEEADTWIPFYIMTSDKNHDETKAFFKSHNYFGYNSSYIYFFRQEMVPSVDLGGKVYLEDTGTICMSPNGNGGWFSSLDKAGYLEGILSSNIKWINVFSVDNVLQGIADPVFLGAIIDENYECGGKVVKKVSPDERVGVLCTNNNRPHIVEYYELTEEMRNKKNSDGEYAYAYGVTLNYIFPVSKLLTIMNEHMPLHVVKKAIPHIDEEGNTITPSEPNGYKFETLALDMIRFMDSCLPFEVDREKEFAPIKNATGVDSIDTARELLKKNNIEL